MDASTRTVVTRFRESHGSYNLEVVQYASAEADELIERNGSIRMKVDGIKTAKVTNIGMLQFSSEKGAQTWPQKFPQYESVNSVGKTMGQKHLSSTEYVP